MVVAETIYSMILSQVVEFFDNVMQKLTSSVNEVIKANGKNVEIDKTTILTYIIEKNYTLSREVVKQHIDKFLSKPGVKPLLRKFYDKIFTVQNISNFVKDMILELVKKDPAYAVVIQKLGDRFVEWIVSNVAIVVDVIREEVNP